MPNSIEIGLLVLGGVLLLVAVLGGKFKLWGAEIEGTTGRAGRIGALILGLVFIILALGV